MKRYIIVDTESNGPEVWAEVYQVAWQITDAEFTTLKSDGGFLAPITRMNSKAKKITGFERKELIKKAESADALYGRLLRDLRGCKAIIGHSVDGDIARLINDARRRCSEEVSIKIDATLSSIPIFDTAERTKEAYGRKITKTRIIHGQFCSKKIIGSPSLVGLARQLQIMVSDIQIHSADGDVELTRRCMEQLQKSNPSILSGIGKITLNKE